MSLLRAVVVTTRSRDREAGTLRAIGLTPSAMAAVIETQAVVPACLAVLAGLPLGVALGRNVWTAIAGRAHAIDQPVIAWTGMGWAALATLVGATVLGAPIAI